VLVVSGTIHAADGKAFDEVSLFGPTDVIDVSGEGTRRFRWTPEDFGLATRPAADLAALAVDGPQESAAAIRAVLDGGRGPGREIVVLNAAAVLWAAGKAGDPEAAARLAADAIDSGAAAAVLAGLKRTSRLL
jgi:anthranilate phosphoribosyltransferase